MKDDIIVNPMAEAYLTDSFDERVEKNKLVKDMDKGLRSHANTLSKQGQRIKVLEDQGNLLLSDTIEQGEDIKKIKEELRILRARSESARSAIEALFEIIDDELRVVKTTSLVMSILFFIMLVINLILRFKG